MKRILFILSILGLLALACQATGTTQQPADIPATATHLVENTPAPIPMQTETSQIFSDPEGTIVSQDGDGHLLLKQEDWGLQPYEAYAAILLEPDTPFELDISSLEKAQKIQITGAEMEDNISFSYFPQIDEFWIFYGEKENRQSCQVFPEEGTSEFQPRRPGEDPCNEEAYDGFKEEYGSVVIYSLEDDTLELWIEAIPLIAPINSPFKIQAPEYVKTTHFKFYPNEEQPNVDHITGWLHDSNDEPIELITIWDLMNSTSDGDFTLWYQKDGDRISYLEVPKGTIYLLDYSGWDFYVTHAYSFADLTEMFKDTRYYYVHFAK